MQRIIVVGNSCAGKTTFAKKLAEKLGAKHVELDALFWEPQWKEAEAEVFRSRVLKALETDFWIVDGNYRSKIQDIVWRHADTIVWLDPALPRVLFRFFRRSFRRSFRNELLWNGCRETLRNSVFQSNSLLIWILKTHGRNSKSYMSLKTQPPPGVQVHRLRTNAEVEQFLAKCGGT